MRRPTNYERTARQATIEALITKIEAYDVRIRELDYYLIGHIGADDWNRKINEWHHLRERRDDAKNKIRRLEKGLPAMIPAPPTYPIKTPTT
jgi:hypothetical protein